MSFNVILVWRTTTVGVNTERTEALLHITSWLFSVVKKNTIMVNQ